MLNGLSSEFYPVTCIKSNEASMGPKTLIGCHEKLRRVINDDMARLNAVFSLCLPIYGVRLKLQSSANEQRGWQSRLIKHELDIVAHSLYR